MRYFGKNDQKDLWSDKMIKGTKTDFNSGKVIIKKGVTLNNVLYYMVNHYY